MAKRVSQLGLASDEIPAQADASQGPKKSHRTRNTVIAVVIALLVVYFALLGRSYLAIQDATADVTADYAELTTAAKKAQYSSAISAARRLTKAMDKIQAQTQLWVWGIPARLPIIGDDVRMARTLAAVGKRSCDDALIPVCDKLEKVIPADGSKLGSAKDLSSLLKELDSAEDVTKDCERQVKAQGDAHFDDLNDKRDELLSLLSGINDTYENLQDEISLLKSASDLVSLITG
ncbi:MAG: hypothetical protein ACI38Z_03285 [Parafannyhessea sp.]|uniref:hypothetical protein n=1 Tax=Parafannyhessea sp. TaxID=2847324 RepID=UPI003F028AB2